MPKPERRASQDDPLHLPTRRRVYVAEDGTETEDPYRPEEFMNDAQLVEYHKRRYKAATTEEEREELRKVVKQHRISAVLTRIAGMPADAEEDALKDI